MPGRQKLCFQERKPRRIQGQMRTNTTFQCTARLFREVPGLDCVHNFLARLIARYELKIE